MIQPRALLSKQSLMMKGPPSILHKCLAVFRCPARGDQMERLQPLISSRRRCRGDCRLDVMVDEIDGSHHSFPLVYNPFTPQ